MGNVQVTLLEMALARRRKSRSGWENYRTKEDSAADADEDGVLSDCHRARSQRKPHSLIQTRVLGAELDGRYAENDFGSGLGKNAAKSDQCFPHTLVYSWPSRSVSQQVAVKLLAGSAGYTYSDATEGNHTLDEDDSLSKLVNVLERRKVRWLALPGTHEMMGERSELTQQ